MPPSNDKTPMQREIDKNLQDIFDQTLKEPIPKQLTDLLAQLKEQDGTKRGAGSDQ